RCQLAAPTSSRETYRREDQRRQDRETTEPDRCQEPEPRAALPGRGLPLGTFDQLVVSAVLGDALVECRDRPALPRLNKARGYGERDEGRHGLKRDAHGESRRPLTLVRHEIDTVVRRRLRQQRRVRGLAASHLPRDARLAKGPGPGREAGLDP